MDELARPRDGLPFPSQLLFGHERGALGDPGTQVGLWVGTERSRGELGGGTRDAWGWGASWGFRPSPLRQLPSATGPAAAQAARDLGRALDFSPSPGLGWAPRRTGRGCRVRIVH